MAFKMPPGPLGNSMLSLLEAWRETRRQVIESKTEIQGGFFASKNHFSCCCLRWEQKKIKSPQVLLTPYFYPKVCTSRCCSQSPKILRCCHQSSHFSKRIAVQPSHVLKPFLFTHKLWIMNVMQTVRNKVILDILNWEWVREREKAHVSSFESLELRVASQSSDCWREEKLSRCWYTLSRDINGL